MAPEITADGRRLTIADIQPTQTTTNPFGIMITLNVPMYIDSVLIKAMNASWAPETNGAKMEFRDINNNTFDTRILTGDFQKLYEIFHTG